jgi:hypothetical protein
MSAQNESFGKIGRRYAATPAAKNDHGGVAIGRRAFMRMSSVAIWISTLASGVGGIFAVSEFYREKAKEDQREAFDLLNQLFGCNQTIVPLATLPAVNHPNVRGTKDYFSESGRQVSGDFFKALRRAGCTVRSDSGKIRLQDGDTGLVIGSRLANTYAEKYLGPADRLPDSDHFLKDTSGLRVRPKWTFYSDPTAAGSEVVQWGKAWLSRSNIIADRDNGTVYSSPECVDESSGKKYRKGDYLLVTTVPRYGVENPQRLVIFEGLHRNGTLAAGLICKNPVLADLREIARSIGANPYYQALFTVETSVDRTGEAFPARVTLHGSFPLTFR